MLHKTAGIVIGYIKFKDTSIITKIFTNAFGLKSYIFNGVRKKNPRYNIALFQPLTTLDLVVYHKPSVINRVSEIKNPYPWKSIPFNLSKLSICMFLSDVLQKSLYEEEVSPAMFEFIQTSIQKLDRLDGSCENFHIQFLLKLTPLLGFEAESPNVMIEELTYAGYKFSSTFPTDTIQTLKEARYDSPVSVIKKHRQEILAFVLAFYQLHIENFKEIKSSKILSEVFK